MLTLDPYQDVWLMVCCGKHLVAFGLSDRLKLEAEPPVSSCRRPAWNPTLLLHHLAG
jgi:hypothetical protein